MSGKKAFVAVAITTALAVLGISSAAGSSCRDDPSQCGGFVIPCSLDGVNPVYHPRIFGNPAVARSYGFVRSRDGAWYCDPIVVANAIIPKRPAAGRFVLLQA
jgi:hypothetical protein